ESTTVTARSDSPPTVVRTVEVLFVPTESTSSLATTAVLVSLAATVVCTTRISWARPLTGRLARSQVRMPPPLTQEPWETDAERRATLGGKESIRRTWFAALGPRLVTLGV